MNAPWLPKGFHTITPNIIVEDAEKAAEFFKEAFGASEKLGDSIFNLGTSMKGWPVHGLVAQIYVQDSDFLFNRAVQADATVIMPMTDMFFGSREGRVADPFGNIWTIATL